MTELKEQIKVVADARSRAQELKGMKEHLYDEWAEMNKELLTDYEAAKQAIIDAESLLRELTLQAYKETGSKTPCPGVGVREVTKLSYDQKIAFDWAKSHKMALKLDVTAFEKIVKADTPDFVKITTEAQATIATDLNKVLEGE